MKSVDSKKFIESNRLQCNRFSNGVPLLTYGESRKLLHFCSLKNVGVLGIEGFYVTERSITPEINCIADMSAIINNKDFIVNSVEFSKSFWKFFQI